MLDFSFLLKIKEWIKTNHQNIYLFFGIFLVGGLAFEGGFLRGSLAQSEPLIVSVPVVAELQNNITQTDTDTTLTNTDSARTDTEKTGKCVFVGSKNSNKYHLPTCAVAKRIKPENRVCFSSKEDAEKKGYVPSCIK